MIEVYTVHKYVCLKTHNKLIMMQKIFYIIRKIMAVEEIPGVPKYVNLLFSEFEVCI